MYKEKYFNELRPELKKELGLKNVYQVPRLEKIIVGVGIGTLLQKSKDYSHVEQGLEAITGQKPVLRKSRLAISNFKLRKGMPVGLQVTLRGKRMYEFYDRLIMLIFPRIRDFRGFSKKSFDTGANYSLGLKENMAFPELVAEDLSKLFGLQITFVTSTRDKDHAQKLLTSMGFPFRKDEK